LLVNIELLRQRKVNEKQHIALRKTLLLETPRLYQPKQQHHAGVTGPFFSTQTRIAAVSVVSANDHDILFIDINSSVVFSISQSESDATQMRSTKKWWDQSSNTTNGIVIIYFIRPQDTSPIISTPSVVTTFHAA